MVLCRRVYQLEFKKKKKMRNKKKHLYRGLHKKKCLKKNILFVFALTFPGVAYQPHSSMTVSAAFVADVQL